MLFEPFKIEINLTQTYFLQTFTRILNNTEKRGLIMKMEKTENENRKN